MSDFHRNTLHDKFGRRITDLRISITDRCNFRCIYCIPQEGVKWQSRAEILTYEEILRLARLFAAMGITKIRVTGGEPLVRRDAEQFIQELSRIPGIEDLALTTNAYFLPDKLEGLVAAGLKRINISVDTLSPRKFALMTGRNVFSRVREAIYLAVHSPLQPVKLNVVVIRGVNEDEVLDFVELAREIRCCVRFIEFMPLEGESSWKRDKVVTGSEIRSMIGAVYPLIPRERSNTSETAVRYRFADSEAEVGFVNPVSEPFCQACSRLRMTADGKIRTCLFSLHDHDVKHLLRGGADDETLIGAIRTIVDQKEERHHINDVDFQRPARTMSCIGG
jgi:cyclic pyranopterin phosphate synthase